MTNPIQPKFNRSRCDNGPQMDFISEKRYPKFCNPSFGDFDRYPGHPGSSDSMIGKLISDLSGMVKTLVDQFPSIFDNILKKAPSDVENPTTTPGAETPAIPTPEEPGQTTDTEVTNPETPVEKTATRQLRKTGKFLWKPVSEKDEHVAVLFRPKLADKIKKVELFSPDGSKSLGEAKSSGIAEDGRPVYRFKKEGSKYPDGSVVTVTLKGGGTRTLTIENTSERKVW